MTTSERRVRSDPPQGRPTLEATEEAGVNLVPRAQRRKRVKAKAKAPEPIPEEEPEEQTEPEPTGSAQELAEARELLEEPQPVVPEEIAEAAAAAEEAQEEQAVLEEADYDADEDQFHHVDAESDWGGSIVTEASYEVCEIPDIYAANKAAVEAKEATQKLQARRLQAPPLYAAGVAGSSAQSSAGPTPLVEAELSKALGLCEQIQGALSQRPQLPQTEVVDERPVEEREPDVATGERDAAADGRSSDSGGSVNYRTTESAASERTAAGGERSAGAAPGRRHGTIAAILAADRKRRRRGSPAQRGEPRP